VIRIGLEDVVLFLSDMPTLKCIEEAFYLQGTIVGALRGFLEACILAILPLFYAGSVILLALYLKVVFDVSGLVTVFAAIAPAVGVWAWIMHQRETKSAEAQAKGFNVSPEMHARALDEYVDLLKKKEETES
jgi:hypothetical protein